MTPYQRLASVIALALACCAPCLSVAAQTNTQASEPALFAYGTIDALLAGAYDGEMKVQDLLAMGDFGLGTFNHLDGEMIVLDGKVYHARADGTVQLAAADELTPLAYVLPFHPQDSFPLSAAEGMPIAALERLLDARAAQPNLFFAVKVRGEFTHLTTRAIAPQARPYRALAEVSKEQKLFERDKVSGSLIGLRSPAFSKGISVPGWHWHFLADPGTAGGSFGGHVLSGSLEHGIVELAKLRSFTVRLPDTADFNQADQSKDRAAELRQVESDRH